MPLHKHGMCRSLEYRRWVYMKYRVRHDPKYTTTGITICAEWDADFAAFYLDMGAIPTPQHTLDRIDGTKGYGPDNCRWATYAEQNSNLKSNVRVAGKHLAEWARYTGLSHTAVSYRARNGLDMDAPKLGKQTHCRNGHEWNDTNTYLAVVKRKQGGTREQRYCRVCRAEAQASLRARRSDPRDLRGLNPKTPH